LKIQGAALLFLVCNQSAKEWFVEGGE
jgi:hypothetical protein